VLGPTTMRIRVGFGAVAAASAEAARGNPRRKVERFIERGDGRIA
jgi:hypothetical protein